MAANNALKITDINFDAIKSNLKDYLSSQAELKDYDYESSTVQTIMNLLSYNTYYNSIYLNMVANEMYLDSAQIRSNVVSRAKQVGYTPRSARGATAVVDVTFAPVGTPDLITVPVNTEFTTTIDGISYTFSNPIATSIAPVEGIYSGAVYLVEGSAVQESYTVSSINPVRYVLNNKNADTSTLRVSVQESVSNTAITTYTLNSNFTDVTSTTAAYFLQEQADEKFETYFGDGILGKGLKDGNIVRLNYKVVSGEAPNNAGTFSASSSISGYSATSVVTTSRARGGAPIETIDSIKLNAPNNYNAQNRAITTNDYKTLILSEYGDIQSVNVWGGEDNTPPQYGRVYIAAKPRSGLLLSQDTKDSIVTYLADKKSITVEPIVVDASYLYVQPTVDVKFNPDDASIDSGTLATAIKDVIIDYEDKNLGLFSNEFIRSELMKKVDAVNDSITSVDIALQLSQRFIPQSNVITTYTFNYNHPLLNITAGSVLTIVPEKHPGQGLALFSSSFSYGGYTGIQMDDDGFGNVRFFRLNGGGTKIYENRRAGTINYDSGQVILSSVDITGYVGDYITIRVVPRLNDIDPIRSQLILLSDATVRVYDNNLSRITASVTNISLDGDSTEVQEYATVYTSY
tara:strand:- start:9162 stop:11051 length:1890 start_codon:yes stop_codon:yes gene_type:complete